MNHSSASQGSSLGRTTGCRRRLPASAPASRSERSASRNVHCHDTKGCRGGYLVFQSAWVSSSPHGCRIARGAVPPRHDETSIALRVGCTAGDRYERSHHAGGKWPPRRQSRAVGSGPVVVLHLDECIVRESAVSTYRCQDASPKYPDVDATICSLHSVRLPLRKSCVGGGLSKTDSSSYDGSRTDIGLGLMNGYWIRSHERILD